MKQRKKILTVRGSADDSSKFGSEVRVFGSFRTAKYTQDTLHTQLPTRFQLAWELCRILRMQLEQQQSQSLPNSQ